VYAEYLPIFLVCMVPGVGVLLALPCLFLLVGAARYPPSAKPRWLRSAGPAAGGIRPPRQLRISVGAALRTGLASALACLAAALGLATLVWDRTGRSAGQDTANAATYLIFATTTLAVAFSAVSAAIVAVRTRQVAGTLAVLAAFVTSGVVAVATPLAAGVGMCGPSGVLARAGCRSATAGLASTAYGVAMVIGVPRAIIAACLAGAATTALSHLARTRRRTKAATSPDTTPPDDTRPSRLPRAILVASTGAIVANLAIGSYVGYGLLASW
jgi:hypothetical protein